MSLRPLVHLLPGAVALGIAVALWACEDTSTPPTDYSAMLRAMTDDVVLPTQAAFAARADELSAAATAFESTPDQAGLEKLQAAWRAARAGYRTLDAWHFGPVADQGISERIDVAPADTVAIDTLVASTAPLDEKTIPVAGGRQKGFLGMEYLLFTAEAGAGGGSALVRLAGEGPPARRRTLVRMMAEEVASSAHQLAEAWTNGYAAEVKNAGKTSARYPSQRAAIDELVGGIGFALELVVGVRLAMPLGRKNGGTPDPKLDPTGASDSLVADGNASLAGIRALYRDPGFATRVRVRSTVLDARVVAQLDDCAAKLTAIPAPFATAVTTDTASVDAAYQSCKTLKGTWNVDVTSAVGATLKPSDNDGD